MVPRASRSSRETPEKEADQELRHDILRPFSRRRNFPLNRRRAKIIVWKGGRTSEARIRAKRMILRMAKINTDCRKI